MRLVRARRARLALLLGLAVGGCGGETGKRAGGGRDGSSKETSPSADTMALSVDAWLTADEPRWACTSNGHASEGDLQPFWARLYDAHADFVFNGHNHFYQRYKPLNKASTAAEDTTAGLTEIIVGTGGSSTYDVCSSSADSRVAKALDGDGSLGAMFFTMGADGSYSWEFRLKSDGSVFDAGSGRSHNTKRNASAVGTITADPV